MIGAIATAKVRGLGGKSGFEFLPTKVEKWRASCADKNKKPKYDPEKGGEKGTTSWQDEITCFRIL